MNARLLLFTGMLAASAAAEPLRLHPDNGHYFLWKGKPEILITSGEHYGALLNADFDYVKYFDALAADGLNLTRTFTGAYCERQGDFKIAQNTLAPAPGRLLCPWARSAVPGYANGGSKFDLSKWDDAYFKRLRDFVEQAGKRGVMVELCLFCPFYEEAMWNLSPQSAANNINQIGAVNRDQVYTLDKHGGLLPVHEAMTRKIVTELNGFDNLIFEICNEPYFGGVTLDWQRRIADVIVETEKALPKQHLISENIANDKAEVKNPHPAVSIFNFHYAHPPDAVTMNHALNKVIGDNETGFKGVGDAHYRMEAWAFLLNGGALYNNLDYSFTAGHEGGDFAYPNTQPGGGTAALRRQLKILGDFLRSFEFIKMRPAAEQLKVKLSGKRRAYLLSEPGRQYAAYIEGELKALSAELEVPAGSYAGYWLDPITGQKTPVAKIDHKGGPLKLPIPDAPDGRALRLVKE